MNTKSFIHNFTSTQYLLIRDNVYRTNVQHILEILKFFIKKGAIIY